MAKSTLTCAQILKDDGHEWTQLTPALKAKKVAGVSLKMLYTDDALGVNDHVRSGVLLGGFEQQGGTNCHFTITPDSSGEWTYFHLTLVGSKINGSYYFELDNSVEGLTVKASTKTMIEGKVTNVGKAKHTLEKPHADLVADVRTIIRALVGARWKP